MKNYWPLKKGFNFIRLLKIIITLILVAIIFACLLSENNKSTNDLDVGEVITAHPDLKLTGPQFVLWKTNSTKAIDLNVDIQNYQITKNINYTIFSDSPACKLITTGKSEKTSFKIPITIKSIGTCNFKMNVVLENNIQISNQIVTQIIPESQRLILQYPADKSTIPKADEDIMFTWETANAPSGVSYKVIINGQTYTTKNKFYPTSGGINIKKGNRQTWTVKMLDDLNKVIETKSATFNVIHAPKTDFTVQNITDPNNIVNILTSTNKQTAIYTSDAKKTLNMAVDIISQPNYTYEWVLSGFSQPIITPTSNKFNSEIDVTKIKPGNSAYYSLTLTVRDTQKINVSTTTKGITVYSLPALKDVKFKKPINQQVIPNISWAIPGLSSAVGDLPLTFCKPLMAGETEIIPVASPQTTFFLPTTTSNTKITCTIPKGRNGEYYAEQNIVVNLDL